MSLSLKENTLYYTSESEELHESWDFVLKVENPSNPRSLVISDLYIANREKNKLYIYKGRERYQDVLLETVEESKSLHKQKLLKNILEFQIQVYNK